MKKISLLALLFCAAINPLQAEEQSAVEQQNYFWLEPGMSYGNPSVNASIDMRYSFSDYTVSFGGIGGFDCFLCDRSEGDIETHSLRLMAGKYFYPGKNEFLIEIGLAKTRVSTDYQNDGQWETIDSDTLGIPVRFAKYFNSKYVGFALTADVMYTKDEWITTVGYSVPFGKLRHW